MMHHEQLIFFQLIAKTTFNLAFRNNKIYWYDKVLAAINQTGTLMPYSTCKYACIVSIYHETNK